MEKKSYLKPEINKNEFKSSIPFLATSQVIFDEEDEGFSDLLENCFMLHDDVTNHDVIDYMEDKNKNTICVKYFTMGEAGSSETCSGISGFTNNTNYTITYLNGKFILDASATCSSAEMDI